MRIEYNKKECRLIVFMDGEIDQYTAEKLRKQIDAEIMRHGDMCEAVLDMKKVRFMDSSGIGLILGRYRLLRARGAVMTVRSAAPTVERLLRISGIYSIANEG